MENLNEIQVRESVKKLISQLYDSIRPNVWYSIKELELANKCKNLKLDDRYARALKYVLLSTKVGGATLLISRGRGLGTNYKFSTDWHDSDELTNKIIMYVNKKGDSESYYKSSKKSDLTPTRKTTKSLEDFESKINGKNASTRYKILGLGSKCYSLIDGVIYECRIVGMYLPMSEDKKILQYKLRCRNKNDEHCFMEVDRIYTKVFESVDELITNIIRNYKQNLIKY